MNRFLMTSAAVATAVLLTGCGGTEEEPAVQADTEIAAEPADGMQGMPGMAGMQNDGMMQQMQSHMQMMMGATPDSMMAMMPEHRQMAANMMAQMNREMEQMNMASDTAWTATVDSLRQDMIRMPDMNAQELQEFMPGHRARMTRLMEMHGSMMGNMQM